MNIFIYFFHEHTLGHWAGSPIVQGEKEASS